MLIAAPDSAVVTRELSFDDLPMILVLQRASLIPPLQADHQIIRRRIELRHRMIGAFSDERLIGMIAFSNGRFVPDDRDRFPKTFNEFSSQPPMRDANAVFMYDFEIAPSQRGVTAAQSLIRATLDDAGMNGLTFAVASGRMPTYAGSDGFPQERVLRNDAFRDAIDRHLAGGPFPADAQHCEDPTLALHHRLTGCRFGWIATDFADDPPSGNMRVVLHWMLTDRPRCLSTV